MSGGGARSAYQVGVLRGLFLREGVPPEGVEMKVYSGTSVRARYEGEAGEGLAILATLRASLGSLDRVKRVVKVLGMVNCTPEFGTQPAVINGCSELFAEVFGEENGIGARSAVGMGALSGNISVEIEAIFEVE